MFNFQMNKVEKKQEELEKDEDGNIRYEVEAIVGRKLVKGRVEFKIKWKGYDEISWEPIKNLVFTYIIFPIFI